jgi:hypothetical protein
MQKFLPEPKVSEAKYSFVQKNSSVVQNFIYMSGLGQLGQLNCVSLEPKRDYAKCEISALY